LRECSHTSYPKTLETGTIIALLREKRGGKMETVMSLKFGNIVSGVYVVVAAFLPVTPTYAQTPRSDIPLYLVPSVPARIEAMPRELPRAKGPGLQFAIQLAQAAVASCSARGGKISVLITDSVGTPVVMLSGDGAGERSQLITATKAATAIKYRMASGEVAKKAATDPKLRAELQADPNIGVARGGAFLITKGDELVGALAVSGFTGVEEECAKDAMAKVPLQ
jgi:uncharacterized protein GlcG (DUF336 family)